ncbi:MAG: hypothetical protein L3J83_00020 [Proteobacteria bacterium]|nr:hypothetical protein [Pseudomonadota bacterium]
MNNCNEIQQKIAELKFKQILDDKTLLQHLESCKDCQAYKQACDEMNQAMSQLSDFDADDGLVESTLSSIVNLQEEAGNINKPKRLLNTQWASGLAASFMLVSLVALFPYNSISNFGLVTDNFSQTQSIIPMVTPSVSEKEKIAIKKRKEALQSKKAPKESTFEFYEVDLSEEVAQKQRRILQKPPQKTSPPKLAINESIVSGLSTIDMDDYQATDADLKEETKQGFKDTISKQLELEAPMPTYNRFKENKQQIGNELADSVSEYEDEQDKVMLERVVTTGSRIRATDSSIQNEKPVINGFSVQKYSKDDNVDQKISKKYADIFAHRYSQTRSQDDETELNRITVTGSRIKASDLEQVSPETVISKEDSSIASVGKLSKAKEKRDLESKNRPSRKELPTKPSKGTRLNSDGIGQALIYSHYAEKKNRQAERDGILTHAKNHADTQHKPIKPSNPAQQYLTEINSTDGISYQTATGYWANTYLPGDSSMRLLEASLTDNLTDNQALKINNSIKQNIQPFDYPENSALAVYLNSDVANLKNQQPTRMRIQVGIQAANRQGGQRSPMNIGLVFDMSNKTPKYAQSMKALLLALLKSKQPGDNISLTVAGIAGGRLIEPKDFRHGQIQVVMNNLFSSETSAKQTSDKRTKTPILNLTQAIKLASTQLKINDDPSATLGSSVLMLFSADSIDNMPAIESMVHANAVKGITMSTVSLGSDNHQQLKQLALSGQGHARILQSENNINDAKRVIDAELLASSRAVARALRLRIRLAKGVKLIEVVDSYNLNEKQSQRVRDAELSLDKRLSKNLGIKTDRGEDEEGIQIVIPSFFAGDTHVILLDVVATDANTDTNAIANVTLRYKDLLYLRNAIAREQLNLENNAKTIGPLQHNVMKNALASKFSKSIKQAGTHIRQGNHSQALNSLLDMQKLYQSMRTHIPVWNKDKEILNDEKLLQEYINVLNSLSINDVQKINYIVDSLQYISWRKQITQTQ